MVIFEYPAEPFPTSNGPIATVSIGGQGRKPHHSRHKLFEFAFHSGATWAAPLFGTTEFVRDKPTVPTQIVSGLVAFATSASALRPIVGVVP